MSHHRLPMNEAVKRHYKVTSTYGDSGKVTLPKCFIGYYVKVIPVRKKMRCKKHSDIMLR